MNNCMSIFKKCYPDCLDLIIKMRINIDAITSGANADKNEDSEIGADISSPKAPMDCNAITPGANIDKNEDSENGADISSPKAPTDCFENFIEQVTSNPELAIKNFIDCIDELLEILEDEIRRLYEKKEKLSSIQEELNVTEIFISIEKILSPQSVLLQLNTKANDICQTPFPIEMAKIEQEVFGKSSEFWNYMSNLSKTVPIVIKRLFCLKSLLITLTPCLVKNLTMEKKIEYQREILRRVNFISEKIDELIREFGLYLVSIQDFLNNSYLRIYKLYTRIDKALETKDSDYKEFLTKIYDRATTCRAAKDVVKFLYKLLNSIVNNSKKDKTKPRIIL